MAASNIVAVWFKLLANDILRKESQIASHVTLMAIAPKPLFRASNETRTLVPQEPSRSLPESSNYYLFFLTFTTVIS